MIHRLQWVLITIYHVVHNFYSRGTFEKRIHSLHHVVNTAADNFTDN